MGDLAWRLTGPNEEGPPGEEVTFAVGVRRDRTGWITVERGMEHAAASLALSARQLFGLRDALVNLLGQPPEHVSIDFEQTEEDVVCHHTAVSHLLGEDKECFNCHNARMLARDLEADSYEIREEHVPRLY